MKAFLGLLAISCLTMACGGRATLGDNQGKSFREVFDAQSNSSPKKRPLSLNARSALIVWGNHWASYSHTKVGSTFKGGGNSAPQGGGGVNPVSDDIGGAEGSGEKIKINAK